MLAEASLILEFSSGLGDITGERSMQQHYAGLDLASRIERLARVTMMV